MLRRAPLILCVTLLAAGCWPAPVLQLVDCQAVWRCGDQENANDNDGDEDLCLAVDDANRQATIDEHQAELQADCNAIAVTCRGGVRAVCTASCTATTNECGTDAGT